MIMRRTLRFLGVRVADHLGSLRDLHFTAIGPFGNSIDVSRRLLATFIVMYTYFCPKYRYMKYPTLYGPSL